MAAKPIDYWNFMFHLVCHGFRYIGISAFTFNFHKVVRQHTSGAVEDIILPIPQSIYESKSERIIEIGPHLPKLS